MKILQDGSAPTAKPRRVTIYKLAEDLGLNPGTISRALGNARGISAETRERVREKAEEYGFRPRSISRNAINICAVIQVEEHQDSLFSSYVDSVLDGIWHYVSEAELGMSIYSGTAAKLNSTKLIRMLHHRNVDGVVVVQGNETSAFFGAMNKQKFPYCSLLGSNGADEQWVITVDNRETTRHGVKYLLDLGHRSIGFLNHIGHNRPGKERLAGYKQAMEEADIAYDPRLVVEPIRYAEDDVTFGYNGTIRLFAACPEVTALVGLSQQMTVSSLCALAQLKKRVPADVSLISFDDSSTAIYIQPPLTVLRMPNKELAYAAARWVHQRVQGIETDEHPLEPSLRGELVIRQSTGPGPNR
jgi:DNA-binding LacI/PurR family transcriptional regulator